MKQGAMLIVQKAPWPITILVALFFFMPPNAHSPGPESLTVSERQFN